MFFSKKSFYNLNKGSQILLSTYLQSSNPSHSQTSENPTQKLFEHEQVHRRPLATINLTNIL